MSAINNTNNLAPAEITELNQKWQEIESTHVWKQTPGEDPSQTPEKQNYQLGETIAKIKKLQSEGKSICLFVGRTPLEKLPSHYNEAKENEVWISGDIALVSSEGFIELENSELNQRIHLWFDFNHQEGLDLIQGLFDKIVIDCSTPKFLNEDFIQRFGVLLHSSESEMIFPNPCKTQMNVQQDPSKGEFSFDPNSYTIETGLLSFGKKNKELTNEYYEQYKKTKTEEEIQADKKKYQATPRSVAESDPNFESKFKTYIATREGKDGLTWMAKEAKERLKTHLENIYTSVEEHQNTNYPFTTHYTSNEDKDGYFIVRNFRSQR
jgi:hypothetical protein